MAGSRTHRQYTSDNGTAYTVVVDESNASATVTGGSGGSLLAIRTANSALLPKGVKMRYVNTYNSTLPTQKRRFYVGTQTLVASLLLPGATITGEVYPADGDAAGDNDEWVVTSYRGEYARIAPGILAEDTGLIDGDTAQ
jgi:hypothetical protein